MEAFEVLQKAIPEQQSPKVAKFLGVSANYVNRWRRRPPEDDDPNATGQRSILDRICDLIDVVFLINPADTGLIVQHIAHHYRGLLQTHASPITCQMHGSCEIRPSRKKAKKDRLVLMDETYGPAGPRRSRLPRSGK